MYGNISLNDGQLRFGATIRKRLSLMPHNVGVYTDRTEAETEAFETAFKILEEKL